MKKFIYILLASMCFIILVSCGSSSDHKGEAKTPSGSSVMKGRDYESVVELFEENGFANIKLEKIEDLITGWLTKDGEVEEVSVGGDFEYSSDKWVNADTEVIIRYHTFSEKETEVTEEEQPEGNTKQEDKTENNGQNSGEDDIANEVLTIDNCEELANVLSDKAYTRELYSSFASKYAGRTIEFDGRIDYVTKYKDYDTRYDILVSAGDYDPDRQIGPSFQFENVNYYDLDLDTLNLEAKIQVGKNVRIVAKVVKFNSDNDLFYLDPVSVTER